MTKKSFFILFVSCCTALSLTSCSDPDTNSDSVIKSVAAKAKELKKQTDSPTLAELVDTYGELGLVDGHNHDASDSQYRRSESMWARNQVAHVVLFGDVSEPSAINTDANSWTAYQSNPELYIPYFSGFDLHDPSSLDVVKENLEKGYFGLGEIAGASTYSPVVSNVLWKANDPMDGYLPQIYDLIATYKAPILLHIDPPNGEPVAKLEQAMSEHPDTTFIFGHINAYNTPEEIDRLLSSHPNLYADFFAGFSVFNPEGGLHPENFIPVIKKYPDRFILSTDSGYGLEGGEERAIEAMYHILHLLDDPRIARMIAQDNLMNLINAQPATSTQMKAIQGLGTKTGKSYGEKLSKREAGIILAQSTN
ncbi:putative TIM-barrel fold metal-dependent hydrolase [Paenibacillus cellulosilyticus]|uniref:Putative TIM-barrel fold metal-dependent hydrolase n=1 Tax=Paenibacillus cellulosilyticus TaxID=375489 RepID=A0A2V2YTU6_9BACL|nr:metal-dependent hydrolase [Paenibacillus cellulosilyticus]PWW02928.1 putative TIM-barrel fold metal-dependent hydrolase [Paenibacillus cellulosilyticus]QKS45836.1 metal-dependent hydrolase [Paenibacillus cellulosilyticus]